jgi:hypothetical protein
MSNLPAVPIPRGYAERMPQVVHDHEPFLRDDMSAYLAASESRVIANTVTEPLEGSRDMQYKLGRHGFCPDLVLHAALRARGFGRDRCYVDLRPERGTVPGSIKNDRLAWYSLSGDFRDNPHPDHTLWLDLNSRGDYDKVNRRGGIPEVRLLGEIGLGPMYWFALDPDHGFSRAEVMPAFGHVPWEDKAAVHQRAYVTSHIIKRMEDGLDSIGVPERADLRGSKDHLLGSDNVVYGNLRGEGIEPFTPDEIYDLGATAVEKYLAMAGKA